MVRYQLIQFHLHHRSEHQIDGKQFDAEVHFVFKALDEDLEKTNLFDIVNGQLVKKALSLTVLGVLFDSKNNVENEFLRDWNLQRSPSEKFQFQLGYLQK